MTKVVGPGAVQEVNLDVQPLLDGASEYEFVTILNPLTDDFAILVAQDVPVNMPQAVRSKTASVRDDMDMRRVYGDDFKNPDFKARRHITNDVIIRSGQTINLKGNEAQVAVRQLVNEILQREGKTRLMADPTLRQEVESRIIVHRGSVQDLMDGNFNSLRDQATAAINQSNNQTEVPDEQEFPELERSAPSFTEGDVDPGTNDGAQEKRSPGRPRKA